jgi:hypothetical protein
MAFRRVKWSALGASMLVFLLAALPAARAADPIPWDKADQHVGEEATVTGRVLGVQCTQLACLLAFDPGMSRFVAVVLAEKFKELPAEKLEEFNGRQVAVRGKIVKNGKRTEITLQSPQDISLTITERKLERDDERKKRAQAQAELLERIDAVLDRLADVTERMAAVQERMESLMSELEQRNAALASALASQAPPPQPAYGPPPRAAYETLRSVKRGMSRDDVLRLIGQPLSIEDGGGGWTIWYYDGGRSVSFDARGRVQSLVGFQNS